MQPPGQGFPKACLRLFAAPLRLRCRNAAVPSCGGAANSRDAGAHQPHRCGKLLRMKAGRAATEEFRAATEGFPSRNGGAPSRDGRGSRAAPEELGAATEELGAAPEGLPSRAGGARSRDGRAPEPRRRGSLAATEELRAATLRFRTATEEQIAPASWRFASAPQTRAPATLVPAQPKNARFLRSDHCAPFRATRQTHPGTAR